MIRVRQHLSNMYREGQPYFSRFFLDRLGYNEYVPYAEEELYEKLKESLNNEILSAYPSVNEAYESVSKFVGKPKANIMLTTGTDGAILNVFLAFCDPNDEVVLVTPNYGMYYVYSDMMNTIKREVKYDENFNLDYEELIASINEKTKIIALANPSGFSGEKLPHSIMMKLIERANSYGCVVLIDEVYADFCDNGVSEYIDYIDEYDNIVLARSFSKSYGLAGVRAGYLICNEKTCKEISRVRQNVEINSVAVQAFKIWCESRELLDRCIKEINNSREKIVNELRNMGYEVRNSVTNFCFIKINQENIEKYKKIFEQEKIEVKFVGGIYADYIRVTIGRYEYMQHFLNVMKKINSK